MQKKAAEATEHRPPAKLEEVHLTCIAGFTDMLQAQGYSQSTVEQYTSVITHFIAFHAHKNPRELDVADARLYASKAIYEANQSNSKHRQFTGACKKYFLEYLSEEFRHPLRDAWEMDAALCEYGWYVFELMGGRGKSRVDQAKEEEQGAAKRAWESADQAEAAALEQERPPAELAALAAVCSTFACSPAIS